MAGWISRFKNDVYSQAKYLQGLRLPGSLDLRSGLFVGSGDSYTCALLMEYLSMHKLLAYHPSDILRCPQMVLDHEIIFISASGRTHSNIKAAKIAHKAAIKTIAVTVSHKSALEEVCSKTHNLDYLCPSDTGILGFTATVITCMSLVGVNNKMNILGKIIRDARDQVNAIDLPTNFNSILFIGDSIAYPVACYGALKMNELFGFMSFGYLLDDYYHSPIFSLKKRDCIFIVDHDQVKNSPSANFHNKLKKTHSNSYYFQSRVGETIFERILFSIFVIQILSLTIAEKLEIEKPYYLARKKTLELSSSLIY
jgi:glucosamine 6-phosphate synthetase-like amidotransferase/phosphosugar isomerase protein